MHLDLFSSSQFSLQRLATRRNQTNRSTTHLFSLVAVLVLMVLVARPAHLSAQAMPEEGGNPTGESGDFNG